MSPVASFPESASDQNGRMSYEIDISNRQQVVPVDLEALRAAVQSALEIEQVRSAVLSISLVDNATIHTMNRDHLQHDYPTDVISFQLDFRSDGDDDSDFDDTDDENADCDEDNSEDDEECDESDTESPSDESSDADELADKDSNGQQFRAAGAAIEGEIIASVEMAAQMAGDAGWDVQSELTLYVIHGMLHICGYDDLTDDERVLMRSREAAILTALGQC